MRFSTILISAILTALSAAQSNGTATTESGATTTYALTPAQSSQASCLSACPADDPSCRAACIVINEGDYTQQNRTIDCISECPKGNGTDADNLNYENCQKACIASASAAPTTTGSGGNTATRTAGADATGTGSGSGSGDSEESGAAQPSNTASGSAASASPTQSENAADTLHLGTMGAFVGFGSLAFIFGL